MLCVVVLMTWAGSWTMFGLPHASATSIGMMGSRRTVWVCAHDRGEVQEREQRSTRSLEVKSWNWHTD